jgi:glycosyltransferase involved in cell wall biosynthesis
LRFGFRHSSFVIRHSSFVILTPSTMYWIILTGEYPPQPGGVSDYTRLVAQGLAQAGDEVHVWAPRVLPPGAPDPDGVTVHRLPGCYGPRSLWQLQRALNRAPSEARLLVQYVPQAYGWDTMNVGFSAWLARAGKRRALDIMFHEVAVDWESGWPAPRRLRRQLHALATDLMARLAIRSARRVFMSIPGWEPILRPMAGGRKLQWLPIPSTMPAEVPAAHITALRAALLAGAGARKLIGHFGTFGGHIADALRTIIPGAIKSVPDGKFLLVGRGSVAFAADLARQYPEIAPAVQAAGALEPAAVAEHLAACDLLVQPYIDGVSSRRTSAMAGLALGLPILTTTGELTEPVWAASRAVQLASSYEDLVRQIGPLLADDAALAGLSLRAAALYREHFALERTMAILRGVA